MAAERTSSPLSTRILSITLVLVLVHNNILFTQINPSALFPFFDQPLNEYMLMTKDINDALQTLNGAISTIGKALREIGKLLISAFTQ